MGARPSSFARGSEPKRPSMTAAGLLGDFPPSPEQQVIYDWFASGTGNLLVRARAGTGKTHTIVHGVQMAPESSILLCAFNKRIATELQTRIEDGPARVKTLHALGYAAIREKWGKIDVNDDRALMLTNLVCDKKTPDMIRKLISQLHTKAREMSPNTWPRWEPDADWETKRITALVKLAARFNLVPDEEWGKWDMGYVVKTAMAALDYAYTQAKPDFTMGIDYADMLYLPTARNWFRPTYQLVVVDEAQDMNKAQLMMAERVAKGRVCVVGDDRQAIYSFRGADSGALDRLKEKLQARELPLTTTYRCGKVIVAAAQKLVPDIVAYDRNGNGEISTCKYDQLLMDAAEGDFILSRLNAPLASITLKLLQMGKRARMAGRDVGRGLKALLRQLKCFDQTEIAIVLERVDKWESRRATMLAAYGKPEEIELIRDQANVLRALAEGVETAGALMERCEYLFIEEGASCGISCSSVHKAKGLEANRVFVLVDSLYRRGRTQEEENIEYVAITRAKNELVWVTDVPGMDPPPKRG